MFSTSPGDKFRRLPRPLIGQLSAAARTSPLRRKNRAEKPRIIERKKAAGTARRPLLPFGTRRGAKTRPPISMRPEKSRGRRGKREDARRKRGKRSARRPLRGSVRFELLSSRSGGGGREGERGAIVYRGGELFYYRPVPSAPGPSIYARRGGPRRFSTAGSAAGR